MTWTPQVTMPRPEGELHAAIHWAWRTEFDEEVAKLKTQLLRYRLALEENGIEPPDAEGADLLQMWRDCREVISAAQNCVANLGTSRELLDDAWRA